MNVEEKIARVIADIGPLHEDAMTKAADRLDRLTKPQGSLGRLEQLAVQLAGIRGESLPRFPRKAAVVMAGDHGVCEEGVSAYPAEVTPQMVLNMLGGGAAINVLARQAGADVFCVDVGISGDVRHPDLIERKVRRGTANMCAGPAMTREEALRSLAVGMEVAGLLAGRGVTLVAAGEMGIGNTTPSAAIAAVLAGVPVETVVGRGTGLDDERLAVKREAVRRAIAVNRPDSDDPVDVLAKVGGLEIAALAGLMLGAAARRIPVVIDGFISSAAALAAVRLCPAVLSYLIASHLSEERGHAVVLDALGLAPPIRLDMRLGEGSGAVLGFHLVEAAARLIGEMATFDSAGVSRRRED
ncbi:nicotinate-nucleotide--dimethylbenzimidazole phosphoribosyltransferase [Thermobacillus composti KWC4]|uniref:Nicotinate-nucleotide--dimethylbenzimidazole phosphoribosyltransferase n=1 Tax=Thermobacillus composti (strain DSM 18247 / JCM 13945 / KWC4) TaxID=717605 RepID=L0EDF0_THECK|nr:nicotinate-nucleotide--dimethylbenzimidazole phosphoribosyltransferase [Thermobacillus composti]AGA57716.1 nicotinate-nucleotide--dimethylbenzimidazole phosphoribosyltransferase [Thermobacillus composti KWC4]